MTRPAPAVHGVVTRLSPAGAWPSFSPDGRRLVFSRDGRLVVVATGGSSSPTRQITPPELDAKRPAWSADHGIAFDHQGAIWVLGDGASRARPYCQPVAGWELLVHPAWSGDDLLVVAHRRRAERRETALFRLHPNREPLQLTSPAGVLAGRATPHPGGSAVVFAGNAGGFQQGANQLWILDPPGPPRRLEPGEPVAHRQGRAPAFSPDGRWIAFTSTRPAAEPTRTTPKSIWVLPAGGGQPIPVTGSELDPLHVAWAPDQTRLAFGGFTHGVGLVDLDPRFHRSVAT